MKIAASSANKTVRVVVFVIPIAFGVARLGEHNVGRRHAERLLSGQKGLGLWKSSV